MRRNVTPQDRQRSPIGRWIVLATAAAIPATWGVASATSGDSAHFAQQAPTTQSAPPAAAQAEVTTGPASFVGITPVRVLDTRPTTTVGVGTAAPLGPNKSLDVQVTGVSGIPAEATSVAVNVTIDADATVKSFMTVWPTGDPRPLASTNNAEPGLIVANSALIKLGTDGKISVYNSMGSVNVIVDVTGYFVDEGTSPTTTTTTTTEPSTTTTTTTEVP